MDRRPFGEAEASELVRGLFRFILGREEVPEEQIRPWITRALAIGDPVQVFRAFTATPAVTEHRRAALDTATKWPHGHFYSPVVSRQEVAAERDRIFAGRGLAGLDLNAEGQERLFPQLAAFFPLLKFPEEKTAGRRYYYRNNSYAFGDACIYWAMLTLFQPKRIIEIGSGYSSALVLDTIDILGLPTTCTFVDPYPELARRVTEPLGPRHSIIPSKVQHLDPAVVEALEVDDLLFIDSSHVVKTGSDVHFELTELLPRLRPGVLVHFHDVFYPFEYPARWVEEDNRSWNELYFLHAFLMYNTGFRVEYFNHYMAKAKPEVIRRHAPDQADRILLNPGGGLWLRRL